MYQQAKLLIESGASFRGAVRESLAAMEPPMTLQRFAARAQTHNPDMSRILGGRWVPTPKVLHALSDVLGGEPEEWMELWFTTAYGQATKVLERADAEQQAEQQAEQAAA